MFIRAIDTALMQMLVYVAEEGSFTAAGERLNLTQQAVSAQVKKLETAAGRRLISRTPQNMQLTRDGETMLVYARQIVSISERLQAHFQDSPMSGSVRLGCSPGFGAPALLPLLAELGQVHPKLEIFCETLRTRSLLAKLQSGALDIVIGAQRTGDCLGDVLFRDKVEWVGDVQRLVLPNCAIPLVMLPHPTIRREIVFDTLTQADRTWTIRFESDDLSSQRAAILAGWGVTVFSNLAIRENHLVAADPDRAVLPDPGYVEFFLRYNRRNDRMLDSVVAVLRESIEAFQLQQLVLDDARSA